MKLLFSFLLLMIKVACIENINEYNGTSKKIIKGSCIMKQDRDLKEEDILKGTYDNKFEEYRLNDLYLDKKNYKKNEIYYLKLFVKNNTDKEYLELYGLFGPITSKRVCCMYSHNDLIERVFFSNKFNVRSKKDTFYYSYVSIKINPGEIKKVYIKLDRLNVPLKTNIYVTELDKIVMSENNYSKVTASLISLTFLFSFFSFAAYIRFRKNYLICYSFICISTYFKSRIFMNYLRSENVPYTSIIYTIFAMLYIISLVEFIKDVLKLRNKYKSFNLIMDNIKYSTIFLLVMEEMEILDINSTIILRAWLLLLLLGIALYVSYKQYKKGFRVGFYSFLPQFLYHSIYILPSINITVFLADKRVIEQQELLFSVLAISGVLFYELKELIKGKSKLEESENIIATINESDNLMHAIQNVVNLYKDDIKYSKVMFFRRIDVLNGNKTLERLNYSFSLPGAMEKSKNILYLEDMLHRDKFKVHYICNDISNNELYDKLLPNYKSMMGLRLSALNQVDFGYILILNENETEYEYNDIIKDFRYKITLVTQHFVTKEDEERKYGTALSIKASSNLWVLSVQDAVLSANNAKEALERISKIMPKALGNDKQINKALEATMKEAESHIKSIGKDLDFDSNDKIYRTKMVFKFKWIKEVIRDIKELINRLPNCKLILNIDVKDKQEFYAQAKMLESILEYSLTYLYKKVKALEEEVTITLTARITESRLMISTLTEGLDLDEETLKKEYKNEVQVGLLDKLKSKKEISIIEGKVSIIYYFNILKAEDKKEQHLNYNSINEEQYEIKDDDDNDDDDDDIYEEEYIEEEEQEDNYDKIDPDSGIDEGLNETYKKLRDMPIDDYFKK